MRKGDVTTTLLRLWYLGDQQEMGVLRSYMRSEQCNSRELHRLATWIVEKLRMYECLRAHIPYMTPYNNLVACTCKAALTLGNHVSRTRDLYWSSSYNSRRHTQKHTHTHTNQASTTRMGGSGTCDRPTQTRPLCDIPSGCCSFTGPWTVTRSSLRMLRRVATFCRPLRPVLLLVSFPRSRSPVVGVLGLC